MTRFYSALLILCFARVAMAQHQLNTPPLRGDPTTHPSCVVFSSPRVGLSNPVDVTVELRDDTDATLAMTVCPALADSHGCLVSAPSHSRVVFCRITTTPVSRTNAIRGTLMLMDSSGSVTSAVASRPED